MNIVAKYLNLGQLSVKHWNLTWNQKRTSHMLAPPKTSMPINKPLAAAAYTRGDMSTASVSATAKPSGPATTSHQTAFSTFFFFFPTATVKEEVLSVSHTVSRHLSYTSKQDIHTVFREMILDSKSARTFSCGMDKTIYLVQYVRAHAPYIKGSSLLLINQLLLLLLLLD